MSDLLINPRDKGISVELRDDKIHEPLSTAFLKKILRPNYKILEIGANIGYYARIEADVCAWVYCIEPSKENFFYLKSNLKNYTNVELFNIGVSDHCGVEKLYLSAYKNRHSIVLNDKSSLVGIEKIKVTTVDAFLNKKSKVNLIRMDIEGAEYKVLLHSTKTLANVKPKWLFIELHPIELGVLGVEIRDLILNLAGAGYVVRKAFFENSYSSVRVNSFKVVLNNFLKSKHKLSFLFCLLLFARKQKSYSNINSLLSSPLLNFRASEVFFEYVGFKNG